MFELIVNVLLVVFLGFTYFTHVTEAAIPAKILKAPVYLNPDIWPKVIIILLEFCLILNIIQIVKKNKGKEDFTLSAFAASVPNFFKSKMFLGMVIMVVASFILEPLGFLVTCFVILFAYGYLLGEHNLGKLAIFALAVTFILYIVFSGLLSVNLPRGTVGFLRNFALAIESGVGAIKNLF